MQGQHKGLSQEAQSPADYLSPKEGPSAEQVHLGHLEVVPLQDDSPYHI
jgi:hypothetical protein